MQIPNHENFIFQPDGAPPHYKNDVREWLDEQFEDRWIGRGTRLDNSIEWPPRSCDLTPLDFWLWGMLKNKVYKTAPASLLELKQRIIDECRAVTAGECMKACRNVIKRVRKCLELQGHQVSKASLG
jgi:hypothetical protein